MSPKNGAVQGKVPLEKLSCWLWEFLLGIVTRSCRRFERGGGAESFAFVLEDGSN